jgi:hypothetical protein
MLLLCERLAYQFLETGYSVAQRAARKRSAVNVRKWPKSLRALRLKPTQSGQLSEANSCRSRRSSGQSDLSLPRRTHTDLALAVPAPTGHVPFRGKLGLLPFTGFHEHPSHPHSSNL